MLVIFLLGFFLDFIEIAVVVVPIIAPILLADPSANVTAVWLGVMIGLNIQTSFLTPPFGFALFYLRGVADAAVKTIDIYKGVVPFIMLQLFGLAIVGYYPQLVNYLPTRSYLTGETSPPPRNPRLQSCLNEHLFAEYLVTASSIRAEAAAIAASDMSKLEEKDRKKLTKAIANIPVALDQVDTITSLENDLTILAAEYKPFHTEVRLIERDIRRLEDMVEDIKNELRQYRNTPTGDTLQAEIDELTQEISALEATIPAEWPARSKAYQQLDRDLTKAQRLYHRTSERAYSDIVSVIEKAREVDPILADQLLRFEEATRHSIGIMAQDKLPVDIARQISGCLAVHRDLSLSF
jgi:predicted  nucleic acid-binding Zn-ribbon protein